MASELLIIVKVQFSVTTNFLKKMKT